VTHIPRKGRRAAIYRRGTEKSHSGYFAPFYSFGNETNAEEEQKRAEKIDRTKKKKKEQGVKGGVSVRYGAGLCDSRSERMGFAVMNGG
jgi:hypothetical protein